MVIILENCSHVRSYNSMDSGSSTGTRVPSHASEAWHRRASSKVCSTNFANSIAKALNTKTVVDD